MTANNIKQQILEHLDALPGEQVKNLLKTWLTVSEGDLEDFEQLLNHELTQTTEEIFEYGQIDTALNFQPLTQAQMVEQSRKALQAYRRKGLEVRS
jgi:predicted transcriptional regulator